MLANVLIAVLTIVIGVLGWGSLRLMKINIDQKKQIAELSQEWKLDSIQADYDYETLHAMYESKLAEEREQFERELAKAHNVTEMLIHHYEGDKVS
jgi:hypothetical protein